MDTNTHPYFIGSHAEGSPSETAAFLVGTATEFGIDPKTAIARVTRPDSGYLVTEALAEAISGALDGSDERGDGYDESGWPLDGGPEGKVKPNTWGIMDDEEKRVYVYGEGQGTPEAPEPGEAGSDPVSEPDEDEPVDYSTWDYADLKSAVATRGLDTEDQKAATLVAALTADDQAQAADETE